MAGKKRYRTDHEDPFVTRLERVRERLEYSQRGMAEQLGIPFRTYQKWIYIGQKPRHGGAILARAEALITPKRTDCWDALECGRGPNGDRIRKEGLCPAAVDSAADGVNNGTNGGRVCWAISGTFCGGQSEGTEAVRFVSCLACDFLKQVLQEEGLVHFKLLKPGQSYTQA